MQKRKSKNITEAIQLEEVKEILSEVDHEFFNTCQYESGYSVIVSMPLMYPNMDYVHPMFRNDLHFKIRCRVNEYSFSMTDEGYIGHKFQSLGYYGFSTYAFEVQYHKKEMGRRLKVWYDLIRTVLPLIGVK